MRRLNAYLIALLILSLQPSPVQGEDVMKRHLTGVEDEWILARTQHEQAINERCWERPTNRRLETVIPRCGDVHLACAVAGIERWDRPPAEPGDDQKTLWYTQPDTSGFVDVDGARLFFRIVGEGRPLVVLHGGPGLSQDYLAPQFVRLLADEHRLIFFDQRASGRSTGVTDTTRLTMTQFVRDLESVRGALGVGRMNLLGHSFGGLLAMQYAAAHPAHVEKLILLETAAASWERRALHMQRTIAARTTEADSAAMAELQTQHRQGLLSASAATEQVLRLWFRAYFHNPTLSDSLVLEFDEDEAGKFEVTRRFVNQDLGQYDIHDRLGRITAPTLIIHGDASVISVASAKAIDERVPDSRLIVLKDVGHFPYIEAPQAFRVAVAVFLR